MEWVARRGRRADGKEQARRIPAGAVTSKRRSQLPFCLAPSRVALILALACVARLAEIATDIGYASPARTASRLGQHQNSQQRGPLQFSNSLPGNKYE